MSSKKPTLSICIPAYNRTDYLETALESLCSQGLMRDDFEVIISDDASPADLRPVVDRFRERLNISYFRSERNIGHLSNFALSFSYSKGRYVSFLPHDDVIAPGHLARALKVLDSYPKAALLAGQVLHQRYPGAPDSRIHGFSFGGNLGEWLLTPHVWTLDEWMASTLVGTPFNMVGMIIDTRAFQECGNWKEFPLWHDRVWCAEIALRGACVSLPWVCGYYRVSSDQMSVRLWRPNADEFVRVSVWILKTCEERGIPVLEYWCNKICTATPQVQIIYLDMLYSALPPNVYDNIQAECERKLRQRLRRSGRLAKLGLPRFLETTIRKLLRPKT